MRDSYYISWYVILKEYELLLEMCQSIGIGIGKYRLKFLVSVSVSVSAFFNRYQTGIGYKMFEYI